MSALKINYTGRIDLGPNEVRAEYSVTDQDYQLSLTWILSHYGFDPACSLSVEMRGGSQTTEMRRFDLGSVGEGAGEKIVHVAQVRNPELVKIRFVVVERDVTGVPLIRADRDNIIPVNQNADNRKRSFLKIIKSPDLSVPWRVEWENGEPVLKISGRGDLYHYLYADQKVFHPLVLAEVLRQIFEGLAFSDIDESNPTTQEWVRYFVGLGCQPNFFETERTWGDEADRSDVTEQARAMGEEFAKRCGFVNTLAATLERQGD
jgi:hypothetical protein